MTEKLKDSQHAKCSLFTLRKHWEIVWPILLPRNRMNTAISFGLIGPIEDFIRSNCACYQDLVCKFRRGRRVWSSWLGAPRALTSVAKPLNPTPPRDAGFSAFWSETWRAGDLFKGRKDISSLESSCESFVRLAKFAKRLPYLKAIFHLFFN